MTFPPIHVLCVLISAGTPSGEGHLPYPPSLEPQVTFWEEAFSRYGTDQIIYFDGIDLSRVYEVQRIPTNNGTSSRRRRRERVRQEYKEALRDDLESLAEAGVDYNALNGRQRRLFTIWDETVDPVTYAKAARNVRSQRGIRESFLSGISRAGRYVPAFRRIFVDRGLPDDLCYLPHVESSFMWDARSDVGAVGMWQIMRSTGTRFLHIGPAVDERLDPYASAEAAARYLAEMYEDLGSWPLALTAYNQGPRAMRDATRTLNSRDIGVIVRDYRGPQFGFMGRNFYAEFLAAKRLSEYYDENPQELPEPLHQPQDFEEFVLPAYVQTGTLSRALGIDSAELKDLNAGIRPVAMKNSEYLPKGLRLKLPPTVSANATDLFAQIPASKVSATRPIKTYRVQSGDSLSGIAARFRTSVKALQRLNGIKNANHLRAGRTLKLPH